MNGKENNIKIINNKFKKKELKQIIVDSVINKLVSHKKMTLGITTNTKISNAARFNRK